MSDQIIANRLAGAEIRRLKLEVADLLIENNGLRNIVRDLPETRETYKAKAFLELITKK